MAIGKPVIGTGYSGNLDFMTEENSYLVDYKIGRWARNEIYPPEGEWAEPSVEHAAELMRSVYERQRGRGAAGRTGRGGIARPLSPAATGRRMRARLEHLAARDGPRHGPAVARG